jgi:triacylglycerol lipase
LGGGLAIVCAHQLLIDEKYPIAGVMTFGQPKAIRGDLRNYLEPRLDGKYVFFVNDMDPITRVIDPYVHFGHMVRWTDSSIERSKRQVALGSVGKASSAPEAEFETGYIEPLNSTEIDELISKIEDSKKPKYDEKGNLVVEGYIPNAFDHFLSAYDNMLEQLRTHKTKK